MNALDIEESILERVQLDSAERDEVLVARPHPAGSCVHLDEAPTTTRPKVAGKCEAMRPGGHHLGAPADVPHLRERRVLRLVTGQARRRSTTPRSGTRSCARSSPAKPGAGATSTSAPADRHRSAVGWFRGSLRSHLNQRVRASTHARPTSGCGWLSRLAKRSQPRTSAAGRGGQVRGGRTGEAGGPDAVEHGCAVGVGELARGERRVHADRRERRRLHLAVPQRDVEDRALHGLGHEVHVEDVVAERVDDHRAAVATRRPGPSAGGRRRPDRRRRRSSPARRSAGQARARAVYCVPQCGITTTQVDLLVQRPYAILHRR